MQTDDNSKADESIISSSRCYCPYRQASLLRQALTPDKMRIAFVIGAGCPASIQISEGEQKSRPLIPAISGLTKQVQESIQGDVSLNKALTAITNRLAQNGRNLNIEEILTHVRTLIEVVGRGTIDGLSKNDLESLDKEICKQTTDIVNVPLPENDTGYHRLAAWIGGIQRSHPIEVFTPNYDLLMEQALEQCRVPYFDGFVGSHNTFFDIASIEHDNLPSRWSRLWKMHGSINWWRTANGNVERRESGQEEDRQMIYPSHLKYDQSRRLPYLAMLDRMKAFLSQGQAVLVTCGYSFSDQHLNEIILQGLSGNPTAVCFGLLWGDLSEYSEAVNRAKKRSNLSLLAVDAAVLNTIEGTWQAEVKESNILHGIAVQTEKIEGRTRSPDERCKFLLGDFDSFGKFLAQQLQYSEDNGEKM